MIKLLIRDDSIPGLRELRVRLAQALRKARRESPVTVRASYRAARVQIACGPAIGWVYKLTRTEKARATRIMKKSARFERKGTTH